MPQIERSALVNHSVQQMFDLVNDIERYPEYMLGCKSARVLSADESHLVGELTLGGGGLEFSFTTRNTLQRPQRIDMDLDSGKFREFDATWTFQPLRDAACKVSLSMNFAFDNALVGLAVERLFSTMANAQVAALVKRADSLYGK